MAALRLFKPNGGLFKVDGEISRDLARTLDLYDAKDRNLEDFVAGNSWPSIPLVYGNGGEAGFGPEFFGLGSH
uniref:Uncharacterized protein n=1 Tax=Desulfovibrio sp. U5L TaxID=596152 RepID=I2Q061_9BACT